MTDSDGLYKRWSELSRASNNLEDKRSSFTTKDLTVYIASLPRSGSTLLGRLLATHPDAVGLGEITQLQDGMRDEGKKCTCGLAFVECPFWQEIVRRADVNTAAPTRLQKSTLVMGAVALAPISWRGPVLNLLRLTRAGRHNAVVMQTLREIRSAAREVTGKPVLVDASKYTLNFKYHFLESPTEFRTLLLVRDGRGVTYSLMRRGMTNERAAKTWAKSVRRANWMAKLMPAGSVLRVRYEDICRSTGEELTRIYDFLGLTPSPATALYNHGQHWLGGSPSFKDGRKESFHVELDESWKEALTAGDLNRFEKIAGQLNRSLGYVE